MGFKDLFKIGKGSAEQSAAPVNAASQLSQKDLLIINKIVDEFKDRSRKQIKEWRDAMTATEDTENPRWHLIQDLYDDTIDAHLASVVDTRKMATTNHTFYVTDKKSGEKLEEQTNLLNKRWFFDFIDYALEAILKKYSVIQIIRQEESPVIFHVPRRNICPQNRRIYLEVAGEEYIDYSQESDVIEIKHSSAFGILNDIIPNTIWKKNSLQSWAEFGEKFGMPLVTATTPNEKDQARIETMLKKMGEAAQAVLPQGTSIEVHDTPDGGNSEGVYNIQATFHNQEISKRLVGGTMISDSGSSYKQSETHERTLDDKISVSDRRFVTFVVNDDLFPVLQELGFPFDNEKMAFQFDDTKELTLTEHWKIVSDAASKFEFDEKGMEWIAKTFNIPIKGIKKTIGNNNANFNQATSMRALAVATGISLPDYSDSHNHVHAAEGLGKELTDKLNRFDVQIAKFLWNKDITSAEKQRLLKGKRIAEELRGGLFDSWKDRVKVKWNEPDHRSLAMMEMNLFKFSEAKGRAEVLLLNRLLINRDKNEIHSESDFIAKAKEVTDVFNKNYLKTERNFAIATGQNSARYFEFIREKDEISTWQYNTVGDDQVRDEHEALDGRVFYFDDVQARRLWPPNGYGCRCEGIQFVGDPGNKLMTGNDALPVLFTEKKDLDRFGFNRAEAGVVFRENQMYLGTLDDVEGNASVGKPINQYTFKDYGLKSFKDIKGLKPLKLDKSITPDNVAELFTNNAGDDKNKLMGFTDYLNRKMVLTESNFKIHTSGKYVKAAENRHQLFGKVDEILKNPDEIYLHITTKEQIRYIKFYEGKSIVVDTEINKDSFELKTWYENKIGDNIRKGLFIK
jgi:SPP1 gp7 family putative phage head morphogenesis protein